MGFINEKLGYFFAGAVIGAVLAYHYTQAVNEEKINDLTEKTEASIVVAEEAKQRAKEAEDYIKAFETKRDDETTTSMKVEKKEDLGMMGITPDYEILTPDQYNDNQKDYRQVDLTYHTGDGILEDNGAIEDDIDDLLGPDALSYAGKVSAFNEVYVRNNKLGIEFAVNIEDDFFNNEFENNYEDYDE